MIGIWPCRQTLGYSTLYIQEYGLLSYSRWLSRAGLEVFSDFHLLVATKPEPLTIIVRFGLERVWVGLGFVNELRTVIGICTCRDGFIRRATKHTITKTTHSNLGAPNTNPTVQPTNQSRCQQKACRVNKRDSLSGDL